MPPWFPYHCCWSAIRPARYACLRTANGLLRNSPMAGVAAIEPTGTKLSTGASLSRISSRSWNLRSAASAGSAAGNGSPATAYRQDSVFADSARARPSYQARSGRSAGIHTSK